MAKKDKDKRLRRIAKAGGGSLKYREFGDYDPKEVVDIKTFIYDGVTHDQGTSTNPALFADKLVLARTSDERGNRLVDGGVMRHKGKLYTVSKPTHRGFAEVAEVVV